MVASVVTIMIVLDVKHNGINVFGVDKLDNIIKQCRKNKPAAQKELYQLFSPRLFGVCLQYCKDRTEAEDNLQEGFIKIFSNIKQFNFQGSFEGWMRRIMVNTIIASFRKKNPVYFTDNIEDFERDYIEEQVEESKVKLPELLKLIEELPPKYKLVFNLYALEGYTHSEISEILSISEGTSKSNLSRARKLLKDKLNKANVAEIQTA
ncbi:RNA polymerase sigma factor [Saccharicrinis aurantiacus]|uniref:RNA polymerase sigma factor n=1 Tax=Saccharicrinis aurantiacus TaxID=1849719 RepID=UPI001FE9C8A0|nr:sigma-70 family RNA polymerase sigma factor [Saccharicrinis aurantiacus]